MCAEKLVIQYYVKCNENPPNCSFVALVAVLNSKFLGPQSSEILANYFFGLNKVKATIKTLVLKKLHFKALSLMCKGTWFRVRIHMKINRQKRLIPIVDKVDKNIDR